MKSTYSISGDIFSMSLAVNDFEDSSFAVDLLTEVNLSKTYKVICSLGSVKILTVKDIENIDKLSTLFRLNNIESIVCDVNAHSASVLFHFLDDFNFKTARNTQRAIDDFQNL